MLLPPCETISLQSLHFSEGLHSSFNSRIRHTAVTSGPGRGSLRSQYVMFVRSVAAMAGGGQKCTFCELYMYNVIDRFQDRIGEFWMQIGGSPT